MTQLWRMQCLTAVGDVADFCVQCPHAGGDYPHTPNYYRLSNASPWGGRGIVAVGRGVEGCPKSKDEYRRLAWHQYGQARGFATVVNAFLDYRSVGDLVWIRNRRADYYLGKITGDWQCVSGHQNAATARLARAARLEWLYGRTDERADRCSEGARTGRVAIGRRRGLVFGHHPRIHRLPPDRIARL